MTKTQISELYVSIFNRASEKSGNEYWANMTNKTTAQIADDMLATKDAIKYFGGTDTDTAITLTNAQFIETIYANTLNKAGAAVDAEGKAGWVALLDAGTSKGDVVATLVAAIAEYAPTGAKYDAADTVTNAAYDQFTARVAVSDDAATNVLTAPSDYAKTMIFGAGGLTVTGAADVAAAKTALVAVAATAAKEQADKDAAASIDGETFTLTTGSDDTFVGTEKSDLFDASTKGTLQKGDVLLDSTSTDADIANATVTSATVDARIQNVETVNVTGEYVTTGLDLTNVTGTKDLNVNTSLIGGTAKVTNTNSVAVENITAGTNISKLEVTSLSSGTRDTVNVDAGTANVTITGKDGGADKYSVTTAAAKTVTTADMDGAGDVLTVNAAGDFTLVTDAQGIEAATIVNNSAESITVTTDEGAALSDKIKLSGNEIVLNAKNSAAVDGVAMTSDASKATIELSNAVVGTVALNTAVVDEVLVSGAGAASLEVNEATKIVLAKDQVANLAVNIDNDSTTAGKDMSTLTETGTLLLDVNATQSNSITAGAEVETLFVTAGALKNDANGNAQQVTLHSIATNAATNTVVLSGANDLTISTFTATGGDETVVATSMTGDLTIGAISDDATVYGGSGDDSITVGSAQVVEIISGAGDDTIDLSSAAANSKATTGAGDDKIATSGAGDTIDAGAGDDTVTLTAGDDTVTLGTGSDTIVMGSSTSNDSTIKDFAKGTDTIVLVGAAAAALDLTDLTAPTANKYTLDANFLITLTGVDSEDLSDSIQLGNEDTAYSAFADAAVVAGAKDDVIAISDANTITTGAGSDTVVVGTAQLTATVTDFTTGSDKVVLTGAAGATPVAIDLTKVSVASGAITVDAAHIVTLNNGANAVLADGTTDKDASTMIQLGQDGAAFTAHADTTSITAGTFDDVIDLNSGGSTVKVNFINDGGMDTITGFDGGNDELSFGAIDGIVADQAGKSITEATKATSGDVYVMTADTAIAGDKIDYSKIGSDVNDVKVKVTDASIMEDVAAYLNNALTDVAANHTYTAVINNDNNNDAYAYLINATSETITASDISLIGTITADIDLVAGDIA